MLKLSGNMRTIQLDQSGEAVVHSATPGPWSAHKEYILDEYGNKVAVACPGRHLGQGDPIANARLIAAAPDLLAALISCHSHLCNGEFDESEFCIKLRLQAADAIAKATT